MIPPPTAPRSDAPRALVVDDDGEVRHTLARVLQSLGLSPLEAGNGREALALLEEHGEVSLVVSDLYMPEMDGITFLREVHSRWSDVAFIMLTGVAEVSTAVECLRHGALAAGEVGVRGSRRGL